MYFEAGIDSEPELSGVANIKLKRLKLFVRMQYEIAFLFCVCKLLLSIQCILKCSNWCGEYLASCL